MVAELLKKLKMEHNAVNAKDKVSLYVYLHLYCYVWDACVHVNTFVVGVDSSSSCCEKWSA